MTDTNAKCRVIVLEDEDMLRGLLSEWLASLDDITVADQFRNIAAFHASEKTTVKDADIWIIDISLPDGDGLEAALLTLQKIRTMEDNSNGKPHLPGIVVISGRPSPDLFNRLSNNLDGGWAFLLKNSNGLANLHQAINAVRSGLVMVDPGLKAMFASSRHGSDITDQERSVLELVALGKSNSVIADEIFVSEKTVERVLSGVYVKYGLAGTSKLENPRVRATLIFRGLEN